MRAIELFGDRGRARRSQGARILDHVTIRASDRSASERFYATVLQTLGIEQTHSGEQGPEWSDFSLAPASADRPVTRGLHIGFAAPSRAHVDAFWQAGTAAGYPDDGAPGLRPEYSDDYYGAFLLDPDGNSAEAVHHGSLREGVIVDHLWIRVTDLEASTRFYETVAPAAGFHVGRELADRTLFACFGGSFSIVSGGASGCGVGRPETRGGRPKPRLPTRAVARRPLARLHVVRPVSTAVHPAVSQRERHQDSGDVSGRSIPGVVSRRTHALLPFESKRVIGRRHTLRRLAHHRGARGASRMAPDLCHRDDLHGDAAREQPVPGRDRARVDRATGRISRRPQLV